MIIWYHIEGHEMLIIVDRHNIDRQIWDLGGKKRNLGFEGSTI